MLVLSGESKEIFTDISRRYLFCEMLRGSRTPLGAFFGLLAGRIGGLFEGGFYCFCPTLSNSVGLSLAVLRSLLRPTLLSALSGRERMYYAVD